jgi:hypothetical protein
LEGKVVRKRLRELFQVNVPAGSIQDYPARLALHISIMLVDAALPARERHAKSASRRAERNRRFGKGPS